jgi:hypothetical protein
LLSGPGWATLDSNERLRQAAARDPPRAGRALIGSGALHPYGEVDRVVVGDVLVTGQKLGGSATLRTAEQGVLVAVGEDVGVRITRALDRA